MASHGGPIVESKVSTKQIYTRDELSKIGLTPDDFEALPEDEYSTMCKILEKRRIKYKEEEDKAWTIGVETIIADISYINKQHNCNVITTTPVNLKFVLLLKRSENKTINGSEIFYFILESRRLVYDRELKKNIWY